MQIGWNFPSNNYGLLTGIGEAGIETFKGAPYSSLAREICQNSLDARLNEENPVIVEFEKIYIHTNEIPGFNELKDAINRCKVFWEKQGNKKTVDFFIKALKVINSDKVCVLRISDFNTTGLTGSDKEYNTPWQNLVKSSGVSDKGGSAGGSFGIGKSAPFACSELRTIFYSTFDKTGLKATQGVARLVSFEDKNKEVTQGTGYYGKKEKNTALSSVLGIDKNFDRNNKTGTDVYILGFIDDDEWEKEIVKSILDGFLISIYEEKLVIKVGNYGITKETLPFLIDTFKEEAKLAYNYYQVLTSDESIKINTDFSGLGEMELYVLMKANLHRKVLISRSNGMKIFDKANISSTIHFAGLLILKGEKINQYFREMETPQHNAWEPDRHYEPKRAKKIRADLFKYIKDAILEIGRSNVSDEIDADGVGEYLPDDIATTDLNNQLEKNETISDKTKGIQIKVLDKTDVPKGLSKIEGNRADEEIDVYGDLSDEIIDSGDTGYKPIGKPNETTGGRGSKTSANKNEDSENFIKKYVEVGISTIRLILIDEIENKYKLTLVPEKSAESGYVELKLAGEQSNISAKIKAAYLNDDTNNKLKCNNGKIFINNMKIKEKITLSFILDYTDNCSMEVNLYGYTI